MDGITQKITETGSELARDDGGAHVIGVLAPGRRVDPCCNQAAGGHGGYASGENPITARKHDPEQQHENKGKKKMRLDGAEPKRRAGREGTGFVQAQKERQPEEKKDGGLAQHDAEERRRKANPKPFAMVSGRAKQLPEDAHGGDQQAQHEQRPGKGCRHGAGIAEGQSQGQSPGSIAHVIARAAGKSRVVLDLIDARGVVRIAVMDELLAGGPVDDEVAAGDGLAIKRQEAEKQNGI